MFDISKVDSNFKIETNIQKTDIKFYRIDEEPFKIYGVFWENGKYRRLPEDTAKKVSEGVYYLHSNTAGGRVRFITNSPYITIHTTMDSLGKMSHFALSGSVGFDMYADNRYVNTFIPPFNIDSKFEGYFEFDNNENREITINFPLYSDVCELYIGLKEGSVLKEAQPYKNANPIVYYGSSITQGGCASRPGMSYEAIVSRDFNYDFVNLGFSGNAKALTEVLADIDI